MKDDICPACRNTAKRLDELAYGFKKADRVKGEEFHEKARRVRLECTHKPARGETQEGTATRGMSSYHFEVPPGYECLAEVFIDAFNQSAFGKGEDRHSGGRPFFEQPIMSMQALYGPRGAMYQATKKMEESLRLPPDRARNEILGAIVYAAAALLGTEAYGSG